MSRFRFFLSGHHGDKCNNNSSNPKKQQPSPVPSMNQLPVPSCEGSKVPMFSVEGGEPSDTSKKEFDDVCDKPSFQELSQVDSDKKHLSSMVTSFSGVHISDMDKKSSYESRDAMLLASGGGGGCHNVNSSFNNQNSSDTSNNKQGGVGYATSATETWHDNRKAHHHHHLKNLLIDPKTKKQNTPSKEQRLKLIQVELDRVTNENYKLREENAYLKEENERLKVAMKDLRQNEIKKQLNRRLQNVAIETNPGQADKFSTGIVHHSKSNDEKEFIKEVLKKNEFFSQLDKNQVKELVDCCYLFPVGEGELLYKEGESGECLFIIQEGVFKIERHDVELGQITHGSVTGEASVLYRCLRTASCKAVSAVCKVWCLKQDAFQSIMLKSHFKLKNEYVELLRNVPILSQLSENSLLSVINIVQELSYGKSECIFRKGEIGKVFFIVKTGSVLIYKKPNKTAEKPTLQKQLGRGSYFGEKALLNEERRSFDAISGENGCVVLAIESDDFSLLINEEDEQQEVENLSTTAGPHLRPGPDYSIPSIVTSGGGDASGVKSLDAAARSTPRPVGGVTHRRTPSAQQINVNGVDLSKIKIDDLRVIMTRNNDHYSRLDLVALKADSKQMFLLKQIKKRTVHDANLQDKVIHEKKVLSKCDCSFVIKLYRTYKDRKYVYMLFEPCLGGDMLTLLSKAGRLDDYSSKFYAGCVVEALSYLHKNNIIFRNFKTDNTYIDSKGYIKLVELTNAKKLGPGSRAWTFTGEPEYIAPEIILNKGYDFGVDYWSLGIFIYEMLMGNTPFRGDDAMKIYNSALKGLDNVVFPSFVNRMATLIIKKLCKVNPNERLGHQKGGWNEVRKHKWFDGFQWEKLQKLELAAPRYPNILSEIGSLENAPYLKDDEIPPDDNTGWDKDF